MLADYTTATGRNVLVYCRGKFHLPLFEPLARTNPDVSFYVQTPLLAKADFQASSFGSLPNVHFVWSFDELKYKLDDFGAFITTDAQSANAHLQSLRMVRFMNRLGVPVFEMQHGLFQLGLHYYDEPGNATFGGDSLPSRSYADRILAYYPVAGVPTPISVIGYPPFDGKFTKSVRGDYLLVLSNLHWTTYTLEERRGFYRAVYAVVERRTGLPVVWKQHHGEYNNADCKAWIAECAKEFPDAAKRIRFYHLDAGLKERTLSELVAGANVVVSSVSTVLLDCEIARKPLAVYQVPSTKCIADRLGRKSSFSTTEELEQVLAKGPKTLKSGLLHPFDPVAFRTALDESYRVTTLSRAAFLDALFELGQPLNSELRGNVSSVLKETVALGKVFSTIAERQRAGDELRARLAEKDSALADKTAKLAANEVTLTETAAVLKGVRTELAAEREQKNRALADKDRIVADHAKLDAMTAALGGQDAKLATMAAALGGQDAKLDTVAAALGGQDAKLDTVAAALDGQDAKLDTVAAALGGQDAKLDTVAAALGGQDAKLDTVATALGGQDAKLEKVVQRVQELSVVHAQSVERISGDLRKRTDELLAAKRTLQTRETELAAVRRELTACKSESRNRLTQLEAARKAIERGAADLAAEKRRHQATAASLEAERRRSLSSRFHRLCVALLPYGVVCTWKRMASGVGEDVPLFYYPRFLKRLRRLVKFALPYGLVKVYRHER